LVIKIGVLELQGGFALHHNILSQLGIGSIAVKSEQDLSLVDGLIIPGGESTTISLLVDSLGLRNSIIRFSKEYPIMGTCAGLIMMASKVSDAKVNPLGLLDISIDRNAYGKQIRSKIEKVNFNTNNDSFSLDIAFIRAPKITKLGKNITVMGRFKADPIAVLSDKYLGLSFHPELTNIKIFHQILFDPSCKYYFKNFNKNYAA
tara:strand:- start:18 stop:629 length:612 start_codon:yes stop_codon:yes gene_type:complete